MKTLKATLFTSIAIFTAFASISCKDGNKKEPAAPMSNEMHQEDVDAEGETVNGQSPSAILSEYLSIKDALVDDNSEDAADSGTKLTSALADFDVSGYSDSEQKNLKDIVVSAKEQAQKISESPIEDQRKHFKALSKNVSDMMAITGTDEKLYEQFCPMYDQGSAWLSASSEVRNPYYGSEMLTCGKVQRELN